MDIEFEQQSKTTGWDIELSFFVIVVVEGREG
jgi:hypothetical protein